MVTFLRCAITAILISMTAAALAGGPEYAPQDSGLYLTGAIGGISFQSARMQSTSVSMLGGFSSSVSSSLIKEKSALNFTWDAGLGWQFNQLFRMDVTYLYTRIPVGILTANTASTVGPFGLLNVASDADLRSNIYLLDGYLDLYALFRHAEHLIFRPYIGGGVGVANNRVLNVNSNTVTFPTFTSRTQAGRRTDFAYRVMLGSNFILTKNLQMFVQYSYLGGGKYQNGPQTINGSSVFTVLPRHNFYGNSVALGLNILFI